MAHGGRGRRRRAGLAAVVALVAFAACTVVGVGVGAAEDNNNNNNNLGRPRARAPAARLRTTNDFNTWFRAQAELRRESHAMAALGDGWVAVFGGISDSGVLDGLWVRQHAVDAWTREFPIVSPDPRALSAMVGLGNTTALMYGGYRSLTNASTDSGVLLGDLWVLGRHNDGWAWGRIDPLLPNNHTSWPSPRMRHAMAPVVGEDGGVESVVLFGGQLATREATAETWVFHLTNRTWSLVPKAPNASHPVPRDNHQLATTTTGRVMLFGGRYKDPDNGGLFSHLNDTWEFDARSWTWTELHPPSSPPNRSAHAMTKLGATSVLLFGGYSQVSYLHDTWLFDVGNRTWTNMQPDPPHVVPPPRPLPHPTAVWHSGLATVSEDKAVLFGGFDGTDFLDQTWMFTPPSASDLAAGMGGWRNLKSAPLPDARSLHAMASGNNADCNMAVMFGGTDTTTTFNDTWVFHLETQHLYEDSVWERVTSTSDQPTNRTGHAMAAASNTSVLLFGGRGPAPQRNHLDDTWVFDIEGGEWAEVSAPADKRPPARDMHALGYLPVLGRSALLRAVTGLAANASMAANTTTANRTVGEEGRQGSEQVVVMFGGYSNCGVMDDTWAFRPSLQEWVELRFLDPRPPCRWGHAMASCGDAMVVFGGRLEVDRPVGDVWTLADTGETLAWTQIYPVSLGGAPMARSGHAMTSVCCRRLALYGGVSASGYQDDLWILEMKGTGQWEWSSLSTALQNPPSRSFAAIASLQDHSVVVHGGMIYDHAFDFDDGWTMHLGCPPGSFLHGPDFSTGSCEPCPPGSYMDKDNREPGCVPCSANYTTEGPGATSPQQCSVCNSARCNGQGCGLVGKSELRCICREGYYGPHCLGECAGLPGSPCGGNGKCNDGATGTGKCSCHGLIYGPASISNDCQVPTVAYLLGAGGGVVACAIVAVVWRRHRRSLLANVDRYQQLLRSSERQVAERTSQVSALQQSWRLRAQDLEFVELVGRGGYAEVYRGRWALLQQDVAIKKMFPLPIHGPEGPPMFDDAEVDCLLRVRGHPRLVLFFGVGYLNTGNANVLFVVTEFMPGGSLQDIIAKAHSGEREFTWLQRLQCARDVAEGMAYLHSLGFLHRDLKSPNVLSDGKGRFKLADFGLARNWHSPRRSGDGYMSVAVADIAGKSPKATHGSSSGQSQPAVGFEDAASSSSSRGKSNELEAALRDVARRGDDDDGGVHCPRTLTSQLGSLEWMAPETMVRDGFESVRYNHKVDVYAFGVVLWELLACTGGSPFAHLSRSHEIIDAVLSGQRPPLDPRRVASAPPGYVDLMIACWHQNPAMRPRFTKVLSALDAILQHPIQ